MRAVKCSLVWRASCYIKQTIIALFACTVVGGTPAQSAQILFFNDDPIDFQTIIVGSSAIFPVTFLAGLDPGEVLQGLQIEIPPGAYFQTPSSPGCLFCSVDVTFTPLAVGNFSETMRVILTYLDTLGNEQRLTADIGLVGEAAPVPGPIVGAGLPGLALVFGSLVVWRRRRRS